MRHFHDLLLHSSAPPQPGRLKSSQTSPSVQLICIPFFFDVLSSCQLSVRARESRLIQNTIIGLSSIAGIPVLALSQQIHVLQDIASQPSNCFRISAASWNAAAAETAPQRKDNHEVRPNGPIRDSGSAALSTRIQIRSMLDKSWVAKLWLISSCQSYSTNLKPSSWNAIVFFKLDCHYGNKFQPEKT